MKLSDKKIDMLKGPLAKSIFLFTIPIAVGSIIQQLFNSADTWVVGFFSSSNALAAVGTNAEIIAMIVTVSSGLSVGANIAAAKCIGKGKKHELPFISAGAVLLAAVVGIAVLLLGQRLSLPLLNIIKVPDSILPSAQKYLQIYFLGYPFLLLYDFCAAILRAIGSFGSGFLLCEHFCPGLGQHLRPRRNCGEHGGRQFRIFCLLHNNRLRPDRRHLHGAKPCGRKFFEVQKNHGDVPAFFGCFEPCGNGAHHSIPRIFRRAFSSDPAVIQNAVLRTMCILLLEPMCGLYEIPGGTLRGSGHATLPALCTVVGTCLFRIVWIFTVFAANPSLSLLYRAFPLSWLVTTLLTAAAFIAARPFAAADRSKSQ